MDLSERKRKILKAIIENYIETAEPVGSKLLAAEAKGSVSSATIRNEMSELEEMGYIEKPHTSAGRVPSPLGYRLYVDELMNRCRTTAQEIEQMRRALESKIQELDDTMEEASAILSELTGQPTVSLSSRHNRRQVKRLELIPIAESDYALVAVTVPPAVNNKVVHLSQALELEEIDAFCRAANLVLAKEGGSLRLDELGQSVPPASPLHQLITQAAEFVWQIEQPSDSYDMVVKGVSRCWAIRNITMPRRPSPCWSFWATRKRYSAWPGIISPRCSTSASGRKTARAPWKTPASSLPPTIWERM